MHIPSAGLVVECVTMGTPIGGTSRTLGLRSFLFDRTAVLDSVLARSLDSFTAPATKKVFCLTCNHTY